MIKMQGIEHLESVIGQSLIIVSSRRVARTAETASSDTVHVAAVNQLGCELIEDVRGIAGPCQQNQCTTRAAPVEHLELHILVDGDERYLVLRRVSPCTGVLGGGGGGQQRMK